MTERTYTLQLGERQFQITSRDLASFRGFFIDGNADLVSRMSELLWLDIYILEKHGVDPRSILTAINEVEEGEHPTGVKSAAQFKHLPLKGLLHKHYFSAHFILQNMVLGLGKNGNGEIVDEVFNSSKSPVITREMVNQISRLVVHRPLEERDASKKLTGEWIIYIKHINKNYYLCATTHKAGDQFVYDQIMRHCIQDFPDLPAWLKMQQ